MFRLLSLLAVVAMIAVPVAAQEDLEVSNRESFLRIADEAFNQGNVRPVLMEVMAEDFVSHSPNGDGNRESAILTIEAYRMAMPDLRLTTELVIAENDLVMGRVLFEGTFENPMVVPVGEPIPPTGQPVRFVLNTIYRFNASGQAIEEWLLWDNLNLLTQLGVIAPMGAPPVNEATDPESVIQLFYEFYNAGMTEEQQALWALDPTLTLPSGTVLDTHEEVINFSPGHGQIVISDIVVDGSTVRWISTVESGETFQLEADVIDGRIQAMRIG